ncbi:hypothetical protein Tco_0078175 [Tanacetum coccineum]
MLLEDMDQDSAHMVAASKVPMLKPENGNTAPKTTVVEGVKKVIPPTTAEEKAQKRLEVKARKAAEKRFGGNEATKKTQRNLLKQQYENFTAPSSEMLDQTFDRLQKLGVVSEWNTHAVVWRNKDELETKRMDDLYNNLKVYKPEVKWMSSSSLSTQNMAFVSSSNNNSGNSNEVVNTAQTVNTAYGVSTASTQVNTANSSNVDNLSDVVIYAFLASQPNSPQLNFMPPTPDLSFTGLDEFVNKHVVENRKSDEEVSRVVRKSDDSSIIED